MTGLTTPSTTSTNWQDQLVSWSGAFGSAVQTAVPAIQSLQSLANGGSGTSAPVAEPPRYVMTEENTPEVKESFLDGLATKIGLPVWSVVVIGVSGVILLFALAWRLVKGR